MVEKFVVDSFVSRGMAGDLVYLQDTAVQLKRIYPEADEILLSAAVARDIERCFRQPDVQKIKVERGLLDEEFLTLHQNRGAEIIKNFLESQKVDPLVIDRITDLIANHEVGGDKEKDLLKDADCLSFFEKNIDHFLKVVVLELGFDKVKEKFDWMYSRITTPEAKGITKPLYEEAIKKLLTTSH